MASRRLRAAAIFPGSANTSCASRDTSFSVRAAGNDTATWPRPASSGSILNSGRTAPSISRSHALARSTVVSAESKRPCIPFEKGDVRAVAAHRDVHGQCALFRRRRERLGDQRRLAVAARGDEKDLLAGEQIAGEPIELGLAVDEGRDRNDLAVYERIHYDVSLQSQAGVAVPAPLRGSRVTVTEFNVMAEPAQAAAGRTDDPGGRALQTIRSCGIHAGRRCQPRRRARAPM